MAKTIISPRNVAILGPKFIRKTIAETNRNTYKYQREATQLHEMSDGISDGI